MSQPKHIVTSSEYNKDVLFQMNENFKQLSDQLNLTNFAGNRLQIGSEAGSGGDGVVISTDGIQGYDSVLGTTFSLPTDGTAPTFSSGVISNTIFEINTNAVLRTSETVGDGTSASAGILINDTGLYACEANQLLSNANVKILIDGSATFSGTITATTGEIGGWNVGVTSLTAGSGSATVGLDTTVTAGDDIRIYAGSATPSLAPFRVTEAGVLTASNATISGSITSTSGTIGGFTLSSTALYAGTGATRIQLDTSSGIHLGATAFADAPFKVSLAGALTATGATISGAISATSGAIGGWNVNSTSIYTGTEDHSGYTSNAGDLTIYSNGSDASIHAKNFYIDTSGNLFAASATVSGAITAGVGSSLASNYLSGIIAQANLNISNRGWTQTSAFSVTDADTIAWGSGTFTSADGTAYSITGGNTGNMAAKTYIYLDTAISTTVYQTTTTSTTAVGTGKVLIAIAQNGTNEATYMVMSGQGGLNIDAANIVASSITGNEIAAGAVTAGKISVASLSSIVADMGSITAGNITLDSSGYIKGGQTAFNTGTGFFLGYDTDAYKFSIGSPSQNLTFDGTNMQIASNVDNAIAINSGGSLRINDGGDILMRGDISNPAEVRFYTGAAPEEYLSIYQDSVNQDNLVDSCSESSGAVFFQMGNESIGMRTRYAQSFTNTDAAKITSCRFWLRKKGSPTGNAVIKLYAHTGTYGTSSKPTGAALATSDNFDVSTLTTSAQLITFTFTGAQQYSMSASTYYVISFEYSDAGVDSNNNVQFGQNNAGQWNTHNGNMSYFSSSWTAMEDWDAFFYIYNDVTPGTSTGLLFDASASAITPYVKFDSDITLNVDTIGETTSANGVTIDGLNIKDGKLNTANSVDNTSVSSGMAVNVAYNTYTAYATGSTAIPNDDTIPQITEGTEFMTCAITPKSSSNILVIECMATLTCATSAKRVFSALFVDATANALAATGNYVTAGSEDRIMILRHIVVAGSTSERTYRFRAGAEDTSTVRFNGTGAGRSFGATVKSTMTITEYKA